MKERDDYTNYCDRCLTGTGVHTCGEGNPDSEPKPRCGHCASGDEPFERNGIMVHYLDGTDDRYDDCGAVERVQPEPATRYVCAYCQGPVVDGDIKHSETCRQYVVPSTSVEPQVEPSRKLREAKMLIRALLTYSDKEKWMGRLRDWLAKNSTAADILRAESLGLAADSVSHPPLEQEAREYALTIYSAEKLSKSAEFFGDTTVSMTFDQFVQRLAAFVREMDKR